MKKIAIILAFCLILSSALASCSSSQNGGDSDTTKTTVKPGIDTSVVIGEEPEMHFNVNGDSAELIGCEFAFGEVVIPSEYEGKPVTKIANGVFEGSAGLTSVVLPESLIEIGDRAFLGCSSLTEIDFPETLEKIGSYAFYGCFALESVTVGDRIAEIGSNAFGYCVLLKEIKVSEGNAAYESADGVLFTKGGAKLLTYPAGKLDEKYTIPEKVDVIADFAFAYAENLNSVTITNISKIGVSAFYSCSKLSEALIDGSLEYIGANAFANCTSLVTITIPEGVKSIGLMQGDEEFGGSFSGCKALVSVFLPESLTYIAKQSFEGCDALDTVHFAGSKAAWDAIYIGDLNSPLEKAEIKYAK